MGLGLIGIDKTGLTWNEMELNLIGMEKKLAGTGKQDRNGLD